MFSTHCAQQVLLDSLCKEQRQAIGKNSRCALFTQCNLGYRCCRVRGSCMSMSSESQDLAGCMLSACGGHKLRALSEAFMKIEPNLLSYLLQLVCFRRGYGVHAQAGSTAGGNSLMHSNLCLASKKFSRSLIQMDKTSSSRINFYSSP